MRLGLEGHGQAMQPPLIEDGQQRINVGLIHSRELRPGLAGELLTVSLIAARAAQPLDPTREMLIEKLCIPFETARGENDASSGVNQIEPVADAHLDPAHACLSIEDELH